MKHIFRAIFYFFVILPWVFFLVFSWIAGIQFLLLLGIFSIIIAGILRIFLPHRSFLSLFLARLFGFSAFFGVLIFIFVSIILYHAVISPGKLADITISNGKQTVVFLQMSHIASSEFYQEKEKKIAQYSQSGAVFLMEGVQPGTSENTELFYDKMGIQVTNDLYKNIAELLSLESQDSKKLFASVKTEQLQSVDVSIDDLVGFFETGSTIESANAVSAFSSTEAIENMKSAFSLVSPREKKMFQYTIIAMLNVFLKNSETFLDTMKDTPATNEIFSAILDKRNAPVVQYVADHPEQSLIVVPYGALHFNGIFSLLKKQDKNWKIVDIQSTIPYKL